MEVQHGDEIVTPFSFMNDEEDIRREQVDCYLTHTNEKMHEYIRENMDRSALYGGLIEGTGPRYCPSIEDKVKRFPDRSDHQVFIEPESASTKEMYVQGISTSMPEDVQENMYKMVRGMENCEIMRPGYAIEYDAIFATDLKSTLESKTIKNLFFAGQINGSSGYEEAASQGLIAGINAANNVLGHEPFVLRRDEGYIGVLIDDLVTKISYEPYRMMTARAEYRLSLRQDNADLRLTKKGYDVGLATEERLERTLKKEELLNAAENEMKGIVLTPKDDINEKVSSFTTPIKTATTLLDLLKRPEVRIDVLLEKFPIETKLNRELRLLLETEVKYSGYIKKTEERINKHHKEENRILGNDFDYDSVPGLKKEALQKLKKIKPETIAQASRISGVSPSDINVIMIHMEIEKRKKEKRSE